MAIRKQITKAQVRKYRKAEKTEILDQVGAVNGWHRDHAGKAIRAAMADEAADGSRPRRSGN